LQGLARCGLLDKFHYQSTVSGGGYIGSWLSAWINREGLTSVTAQLAYQSEQTRPNPEPLEIQNLRSYSNYLSPRLGMFSADSWTLIGTYLRNLLLNWCVIIPLLAAFLAIALFYFLPESSLLPDLTYHYGAVPVGNFPRVSSTFISASMFCNYLTVTLVFTLLAVKMKWIGKGLGAVIAFAVAVSAIFTVSIALGGVALAAGLWLWAVSANKTIGQIGAIVCAAIAIAFLAIAPFSLSLLPGLSASSRLLVWRDAINTFLADPVTGRGFGTAVANVTYQNSDGSWSLLTDAHNTFLSLAAQSGMLGLIGMIAIVIVTLRSGFAKVEGDNFYVLRGLAIAFLAAFVYDGMTASFEDARHLWILVGLILAANRIASEDDRLTALHCA